MKKGVSKRYTFIICFILLLLPLTAFADDTIPFLVTKQSQGAVSYNLSLKILAVMTVLTVLPALLMTMTAFTRIIIVLAIVRQAIGIPNVPGNQIMIGLALIMTVFVMMPVIQKINDNSIQPYLQKKLDEQQAFDAASVVLKTFMLKQTRKTDLKVFSELAKTKINMNANDSLLVLMPAFITSELKTAFEIGFLILMPFLIIDVVISSILMSMGMMMLSPMVISLPFKILFFVLVNGWSLIVTSLITSFRI
ncbi:MAG: flagellar type III secretion system pore protein FliP [Gammaproteobacteria bacterium]